MAPDRISWTIKSTAILPELVQIINISPQEMSLLGELRETALHIAPSMLEAFYTRLLSYEHTAEYFTDITMEHMYQATGAWFTALFEGVYDEAYVQRRLAIGQTHVRIGLPIRYPLAMLDIVMQYGEKVAEQSAQPDQAVVAFHKVIALDVAIFNQAYEDDQLQHLAHLVGNERLARRLLSMKRNKPTDNT